MLTKEQITKADDIKYEMVPVPEWDGEVRVRTLSGKERDAFEDSITKSKGKDTAVNMNNLRAKLCALAMVDEAGDRLFHDRDIGMLGNKSSKALDKIFDVAQRLSGIGSKDIEELVKNSDADPNESSTSD